MLCCIFVALLLAPLGLSVNRTVQAAGDAACCRGRTQLLGTLLLMLPVAALCFWIAGAITDGGKPAWRFAPVCRIGFFLTAGLGRSAYSN